MRKGRYRLVPFIDSGYCWYQLQRKRWFGWEGVWCACDKERAIMFLKHMAGPTIDVNIIERRPGGGA